MRTARASSRGGEILRWFGLGVLSIVACLLAVDLLTPLPLSSTGT